MVRAQCRLPLLYVVLGCGRAGNNGVLLTFLTLGNLRLQPYLGSGLAGGFLWIKKLQSSTHCNCSPNWG